MAGQETKVQRPSGRRWRLTAIVLLFICMVLVIAIIVIYPKDNTAEINTCYGVAATGKMDFRETNTPSVFQDLTGHEIRGLMEYIYRESSFQLVKSDSLTLNSSHMFSIDLYLPNKKDVLSYLDSTGKVRQPQRAALVTLFRGDKSPPVVEEYKVAPLPNPTHHAILRKVPYTFRPINNPEYTAMIDLIVKECSRKAGDLLFESFGGHLEDCGSKCLIFRLFAPMGPAISSVANVRKFWFWLLQESEFLALHPVDFAVLVVSDGQKISIEKVWYNMRKFDSLERLVQDYNTNGKLTKLQVDFPIDSDYIFSKMHQRGEIFPEYPQRPPIQIEPDGKRYTVIRQEVKYMNWNFHYRMSTTHGPQLYDIRYKNERIVYELGLQEIVVFYSGNKPYHMFANFFDSMTMIGQQVKGLVPGVDCPSHATFMDLSVVRESQKEPFVSKNAFCIFESNTGEPLRRHHAYYRSNGHFYEGAPNIVLVFRTIATVFNYDYIFDFVFYQNGAIKVQVTSSGYILPEMFTEGNDEKYGFKIQDDIVGTIHHHSFNFKIDLDIKGTRNRYETIEIENDRMPNHVSTIPNAQWDQEKMERILHSTEKSAAYKYDFNVPTYHIFYNNLETDAQGNRKSYRIMPRGMSKSILPEGSGNEPSASWMRYQMAVTKHKDSERKSSSPYAGFDSINPTVNFESFIEDNENIEDQDLVAWVTLGTHHIPHTEDLPITHTPGNDLSFYLLPFNYFAEDPSMASRDSIRIERAADSSSKLPLNIKQYTSTSEIKCLPEVNRYIESYQQEPNMILETED